ncbi:MAG: methylenetetrahydrofolate--tRNA-(uracil(54)-C(5))-methyltransferase (FADH(2)-oxidizing) TrmFO [Candidatus Tumulicola sp.]
MRVTIVGGGLAGCEAAWQAARQGAEVDLYEMRPHASGPAHHTGGLAELVCSNSLRGAALENAVGLLKEELFRLDSIVVRSARETAVPAGGALAVDRGRFSQAVERALVEHPRIRLHREEVHEIPSQRPAIVACGPLPSADLLSSIDAVLRSLPSGEGRRLHYFDAAAPIVAADSIDESAGYRKSRYEKGDGDDYLNLPLDRDAYRELVNDLRTSPRHQAKDFEAGDSTRYFEGCLPIEEMADRGEETLRYGPLKPVGLRHPQTGITPYAVVQLRKENAQGTAFNLVGFQTRMTWPAQRATFGKLPGLAQAEWLRLGVMHRNTFVDAPRVLDARLMLRGVEGLYLAGQVTGAEGYVEAAACGAMAGIHAARGVLGKPPVGFPRETALGAVVAHLQNAASPDFQPSNVTWAEFPPLDVRIRDKNERRGAMAIRALAALDVFARSLAL